MSKAANPGTSSRQRIQDPQHPEVAPGPDPNGGPKSDPTRDAEWPPQANAPEPSQDVSVKPADTRGHPEDTSLTAETTNETATSPNHQAGWEPTGGTDIASTSTKAHPPKDPDTRGAAPRG